MSEQQAKKLEEAKIIREKHSEMLQIAKQKNEIEVEKKKEVLI